MKRKLEKEQQRYQYYLTQKAKCQILCLFLCLRKTNNDKLNAECQSPLPLCTDKDEDMEKVKKFWVICYLYFFRAGPPTSVVALGTTEE